MTKIPAISMSWIKTDLPQTSCSSNGTRKFLENLDEHSFGIYTLLALKIETSKLQIYAKSSRNRS